MFARNIAISAVAHVLIIALLLMFPLFCFRSKRADREITTFIDFQMISPEPAEVAEPVYVPPDPEPVTRRQEIDVSRKLVTRDTSSSPPRLNEQRILKRLRENEIAERLDTSRDDFDRYLAQIQALMHQAWQQPQSLSGTSGLAAQALIRVQTDGRIINRELIQPSGNDIMDDSIMKALEAVQRLPPMPSGRPKHEDITIYFELTMP